MWFALYKKELSGFFYGYPAYFIMLVYAVLSLLIAFFFGMYAATDNAAMLSYFAFQPQALVVVIPAMTMRLWAEEVKNGTIETLFTFPFSNITLVTAKFAAGWSFAAFMTLMFLPLALSTARVAGVAWANVFSAWAGTFLGAGLLTAAGAALSLLNTAPAAAYLTAVAVGWVIVALNFTAIIDFFAFRGENTAFAAASALNFSGHYQSFLNGNPGIGDIVYFVAMIVFCLWFNVMLAAYKRSR